MKNFSVTKNFKYFAIVSVLLVAVGVFALLAAPFGLNLFNMDIDFTGGTTFTYDMGQQVTGDTVQQIQQAVGDIVDATPSVVTTGDGTQVMIRPMTWIPRPATRCTKRWWIPLAWRTAPGRMCRM